MKNELKKYFVCEAMQNFPEASGYGSFQCTRWNYEDMLFVFRDTEDGARYEIDLPKLLVAADLILTDVWGKGLTPLPSDLFDCDTDHVDDTLCQMDGYDFDALAQIAVFGKLIYG